MNIRLNKFYLFLLFFLFSTCISFADIKLHNEVTKIVDEIELNDYFKYKIGDDLAFANPNYNDSDWKKLDDDSLNSTFKNEKISWYRVELEDTGLFALEPLAIQIQTTGAVELFLNGIKIDSFGKIPIHNEKVVSGFSILPKFTPIKLIRGQKNVLAIRFKGIKNEETNNHVINFTTSGNFVHASLTTTRLAVKQMMDEGRSTQVPLFFSGAFIVLSIFHFMLFFYYRKNRTNLYYALFTFFIFIVFFCIYKITSDTDIETVELISSYLVIAVCLIPLFFIGILYEVFYKRLLLTFWILFALLTAALSGTNVKPPN